MKDPNKKTRQRKHSIGNIITTIILVAICIALLVAIIVKLFDTGKNMAAFGGPGAPGGGFPTQATASATKAANVYVKEIEPETYIKTLQFFGTIVDEGSLISVVTKASGYVTEVLVSEDDVVSEGEILGYIDPSVPGANYKASPVNARISGTIKSLPLKVGQYVPAGTVFATEKPEVDFTVTISVPERYIDNLKIGNEATITSSIRPELNTKATISEVADSINAQSRTINVKLKAENTEYFIDGLAVTTYLTLERIPDSFVIPTKAITNIGGTPYVYIVRDGKATQVAIETGSSNDTDTLVTSGLSLGDEVIIEGTVGEGTQVNILER